MTDMAIVHALLLPAPIHDVTTCCGMPLTGASDEHRVTSDPKSVTCDQCLAMMGKMRDRDWSPEGIPELRDLQIEDGEAKLKVSHKLVSVMAAAFLEAMKDKGAVNYLEYVFEGAGLPYEEHVVVTVQRVAGKTPAQLKTEAEAQTTHWKEEAAAWLGAYELAKETLKTNQQLLCDVEANERRARDRCVQASHILIDSIGAPGPETVVETAERAVAEIKRLRNIESVVGIVSDVAADVCALESENSELRAEVEKLRKLVSHTIKREGGPVICHTCTKMPDDCFPENNECPYYVPKFKV
jgi:hypothetical protein